LIRLDVLIKTARLWIFQVFTTICLETLSISRHADDVVFI